MSLANLKGKKIRDLTKIGEGASSEVFSAIVSSDEEEDSAVKCAIKVVCLDSNKKLKWYNNELKAHSILGNHRNLLSTAQLGRFGYSEFVYGALHMELMHVDLISYIIDNGNLSESKARFVFREICNGVLYCHINHVYHLDIKADNVMINIDDNGNILNVKLCDFGLSKTNNKPINDIFGTKEYLPIEYYTREWLIIPEKADIWSLGVLLFVIITGCYPFVFKNHKFEAIGLSLVNEYCEDNKCFELLKKMLCTNPCDRPTMHQVLNYSWLL